VVRIADRLTRYVRRMGFQRAADRRERSEAVGLQDLFLSGWFGADTGEVFTGFPVGPDDTYLDVGCGNGGATMFAARQGCAVIATDVQADKVAAVERRLEAAGASRFRCLVSDSDPLPLPGASVTRVVCSEVMEHVPDPGRFLAELVRVGEPGALYLLTVPDPASEAIQRELAPESYWRVPNHVRVFSRDEFADTVERAGLRIEARHFVGFYASVWWTLFWPAGTALDDPDHALLDAWTRTWRLLLTHPDGTRIKQALDRALPKSQVIIARKAA